MARIIAFVPDLMLASRVQESLGSAGHEVTVTGDTDGGLRLDQIDLVVCDLEAVDPVDIAALPVPSIGFYPHVDTQTRRLAMEAGVDLVIPRSRMSRDLPILVEQVLG